MKLVQEWIGLFLNTYTFIALLNYSALPTFRQTDNLYIYIESTQPPRLSQLKRGSVRHLQLTDWLFDSADNGL